MNNRKKILSISLLILFFSIQNIFASQNLKVGKDYVVTENLRLRTSKFNGNKIVCVLKAGAKVRVLKIGEKEVIDEIKDDVETPQFTEENSAYPGRKYQS